MAPVTTKTTAEQAPAEPATPDTAEFEVHGRRVTTLRATVQATSPDDAARLFTAMVESGKGELTLVDDRVVEVVTQATGK